MRGLALGLLLLSLAAPAAADVRAGSADPRIRVVDYDPWAVVRVAGAFRTATEIQFGEEETILHVAVGDATAWDVAAERNVLFVKPKAPHGPTNLIVTTERAGGTRSYAFELTAQPRDGVYGLRFRYPQDDRAKASAALAAAAAAVERKVLDLQLDRAAVEGPRNLAYSLQGDAALQPSEVSDNGRYTVLRFPGQQPMPTLYEVTDAGAESLIPFDVRGEFVVAHQVVRQLRLRRGRAVVCIWNDAFAPYGRALDPASVERTEKARP